MSDIRPRFSLLFADPDALPDVIYNEETLNFIGLSADEAARPVLQKILSYRTTRRDLSYRKEILEDFLQSPTLLTKCETVCRRWEGLYETAKREQKTVPGTTYEEALTALKENTVSLMEHLRFLRCSADEMATETPDSGGLFAFSEYLRQHAASESVRALTEQIGNYPLLRAETARAVLQIRLDDTGAATAADLRYFGIDDGKYLKKFPSRREDFTADLPKDQALSLTAEGICRLAETFRTLTESIRNAFLPLPEGLIFYHFALSLTEWGRSKGFDWIFPSPVAEHGPAGKGIRDLKEMDGQAALSPVTLAARSQEIYEGEWGTEMLKIIARTQIFAAAGLPIFAEDALFCPEERVVLYDSTGKTMDQEIAALADVYHNTGENDLILLNHPLITVGNAQAKEILDRLLRTVRKKGACVRLATNWSTEEFL